MRIVIYILCISTMLCGCAALTSTQLESVNQFGQATKGFSSYPSKILSELAEIRLKRGLYYASTLSDPKTRIAELDSIYSQMNFDFKTSQKVDITFKVIDKYAQSLIILSSEKHVEELDKQAKNFGISIDSLTQLYNSIESTKKLPVGIGGAVNKIIVSGGKQYVRARQARDVKKFVAQADTLISVMTSNLLEYLGSAEIDELIRHEEKMIRRDYLTYLQHTSQSTLQSQQDYLVLKNSIDGVKKLQEQTLKATRDLRTSHKELANIITERVELRESIKELQSFREQVIELKNTIKDIQIAKN